MKKIFILTGEPSGDKLASAVITDLKKINKNLNICLLRSKLKIIRTDLFMI